MCSTGGRNCWCVPPAKLRIYANRMPFGPAPTSRLRLSLIASLFTRAVNPLIAGLSTGANGLRLTRAGGSKLLLCLRHAALHASGVAAGARLCRAICVDSRRCGELARLAKHGSAVLVRVLGGQDAHKLQPRPQAPAPSVTGR